MTKSPAYAITFLPSSADKSLILGMRQDSVSFNGKSSSIFGFEVSLPVDFTAELDCRLGRRPRGGGACFGETSSTSESWSAN